MDIVPGKEVAGRLDNQVDHASFRTVDLAGNYQEGPVGSLQEDRAGNYQEGLVGRPQEELAGILEHIHLNMVLDHHKGVVQLDTEAVEDPNLQEVQEAYHRTVALVHIQRSADSLMVEPPRDNLQIRD